LAAAQNNIGDFYETGRGVTQDFARAAEWYRKAADQGISVAQISLGNFHRKGQGVPQDFAEAAKWYRLAAGQGLEPAAQCLEEMYVSGELKRPAPRKAKAPRLSTTAKAAKRAPVAKGQAEKRPQPPVARTVARRVICLRALVRRSQIEALLAAAGASTKSKPRLDPKALAAEARRINDWLKDEELWSAVSDCEAASLRKKPGTWTAKEMKDWGWRTEALGVLAWALRLRSSVAPYDEQQAEDAIFEKIPLRQPAGKFIGAVKLRPAGKIGAARDIAENWLWRARTTQVQKEPKKYPPPPGWTYEKIIKAAAAHWQKQGLFEAVEGDYPACGKPYGKLTEAEWQSCRSIAAERLYGLNWLCGRAEDWDRVPTDT
jgi:hypothetical protein